MPDFGGHKANGGDPSLNEINRADRFLDALAAKQPVYSTDQTEADLAFLLGDWRDTIRDPAPTVPVTARDAVAALNTGLAKRHSRGSLAIVGSVAAAVLCIGGFGAAVYAANPGDSLYGARTAVFGTPRVSDDQVMLAAQTEMAQVQNLIDQGQWQQAQDKLQQLSPTVQSVDAPEHKQQLIEQWNALTYKVVEQNPQAVLPPVGAPLPALPSSPLTLLPLPVIVAPANPDRPFTRTSTTESSPDTSAPSSSPGPSESETSGTLTSGTPTAATQQTTSSGAPATSATSASSVPSSESAPSSSSKPSSSESPTPSGTTASSTAPASPTSAAPNASSTSAAPSASPTSTAAPTTRSAAPESPVTTSVTVAPTTMSASPTAMPSQASPTAVPSQAPSAPSVPTAEIPSHRGGSSRGSGGSSGGHGQSLLEPTLQMPFGQH